MRLITANWFRINGAKCHDCKSSTDASCVTNSRIWCAVYHFAARKLCMMTQCISRSVIRHSEDFHACIMKCVVYTCVVLHTRITFHQAGERCEMQKSQCILLNVILLFAEAWTTRMVSFWFLSFFFPKRGSCEQSLIIVARAIYSLINNS